MAQRQPLTSDIVCDEFFPVVSNLLYWRQKKCNIHELFTWRIINLNSWTCDEEYIWKIHSTRFKLLLLLFVRVRLLVRNKWNLRERGRLHFQWSAEGQILIHISPPPLFFFLTSSAFLVWFSMISVNTTCNCVKTQTTICNCKLSCNECNSYKVKHRPFYVSCFLKKLKGNMRIMKENENHFQCQNGREGMASRLKATNQ